MANSFARLGCGALIAATAFSSAEAQGLLVDQRNDGTIPNSFYLLAAPAQGISGTLPFGQEFTPSLAGAQWFEFLVNSVAPPAGPGTFQVNIRLDSVTGPIIGASEPVSVPFGVSQGTVRADFGSLVPLVGGQQYVAELVPLSGGWLYFASPNSGYSGGRLIMSGRPTETDLWFREGIIVPEPGSVWLALVAALLAWLRIRLGAAMRGSA
jgi:hypothetical protein